MSLNATKPGKKLKKAKKGKKAGKKTRKSALGKRKKKAKEDKRRLAGHKKKSKQKKKEKQKHKPLREPLRVRTHAGDLTKFRTEKIQRAVTLAAEAADAKADAEKLAKEVATRLKRRTNRIVTIEEIHDVVEDVLVKSDLTAVAKAYILHRKKQQQERDAKTAILGRAIRTQLSLNAVRLLHERYLMRDEDGKLQETPDAMFNRIAGAVAEAEATHIKGTQEEKESAVRLWKGRFKRAMSNLDFLPSSTILMNAGTGGQLASSIALPVEDHLRDIFGTLGDAVDMQRHGSGTGFNFSNIRERFANVHTHHQISGGPLQFLHVYNEALDIIMQNGRRKGANMAILSVHHPDVLDFISAKVKEFQLTNFNISVALTEEFMRSAILDREYDLVTPTTGDPVKTMYAKQVFDILVASAWNYADPGVLFFDRIEADNPIKNRPILSTSACAEFMLSAYECGFIGSINLANFVEKTADEKTGKVVPTIDYKSLRETIFLAIRFLDDIIDINNFPLKQSERAVNENRKIGLGVMGFAHMLYQLKVPYNSDAGVDKAHEVAKFIRAVADEASFELARERGPFPAWRRSKYAKKEMLLRNASRLAISPTGSISMIAETSASIEPAFALSYVQRVMDGKEMSFIDQYLKEALDEAGVLSDELLERIANHGLTACDEVPDWIKKVFVTTHQVSPTYHVRMQAAWQEFVDNGVSKTVNLPYDATLLDVENVFLLAYKLGCKGVTVYRDGTKQHQVLELTTLMQKRTERKHVTSVREELKGQLENKSLSEF